MNDKLNKNHPIIRQQWLQWMTLCTAVTFIFAAALEGAVEISNKNMKLRWSRRQPNIIYILADDLGYGDLGCYYQKRIKTPRLDRMAAEGMRFMQHYSGSTVCAPSRGVLMTGQHTGHTRIRGNGSVPLAPEDVTVAELLKNAGYATAITGKWGCGEEGSTGIPNLQGFDYFYGYLNQTHAHNYYPDWLWQNQTKVKLDNIVIPVGGGLGGVSTNKVEYSHDLFTREALNFIRENKDRPFFLYIPYTIPHTNNQAGCEGMEVPDLGIYADKNWPDPEKGKAAMISWMDRDIGRILDLLEELKIDEDTIVMFSSDNGPHSESCISVEFHDSNWQLRGKKRDQYEGGVRVPFIVRWPGKVKPGTASDHISAFWDVLPTCTDLAGVDSPDNIDGISFLPELLGEEQPEHEFMYWEFYEQNGKQAIRQGKWKGIRFNMKNQADPPVVLYNLETDLGETTNIAAQFPDKAAELKQLMIQAHIRSPHWKFFGE